MEKNLLTEMEINWIVSFFTRNLFQVEYAMEAVKQGSATVALKSDTHAVLVALKRASSDLSSHQKKILPIDDHVGISIAGLTADARSISRWMRAECMNSRYAHDTPLPVSRYW